MSCLRFCYLQTCGCVFSERALKEVKTEICHKVRTFPEAVTCACPPASPTAVNHQWCPLLHREVMKTLEDSMFLLCRTYREECVSFCSLPRIVILTSTKKHPFSVPPHKRKGCSFVRILLLPHLYMTCGQCTS